MPTLPLILILVVFAPPALPDLSGLMAWGLYCVAISSLVLGALHWLEGALLIVYKREGPGEWRPKFWTCFDCVVHLLQYISLSSQRQGMVGFATRQLQNKKGNSADESEN
ncbi:MAG: hypothetical protein QOD00_1809 [Blastocatellia bacterium]|nr:hypothetical protein [Blastocatellia bacterium]